jgi:isopropylmalate/homocitrate/citramalate synthase
LGIAVANSIMGAKGVLEEDKDAFIDTKVNGIGERVGNAELISIVVALKYRAEIEDLGIADPRIDLSKAWEIAAYASHAFSIIIPISQQELETMLSLLSQEFMRMEHLKIEKIMSFTIITS